MQARGNVGPTHRTEAQQYRPLCLLDDIDALQQQQYGHHPDDNQNEIAKIHQLLLERFYRGVAVDAAAGYAVVDLPHHGVRQRPDGILARPQPPTADAGLHESRSSGRYIRLLPPSTSTMIFELLESTDSMASM